jgi:hypothetical protein
VDNLWDIILIIILVLSGGFPSLSFASLGSKEALKEYAAHVKGFEIDMSD